MTTGNHIETDITDEPIGAGMTTGEPAGADIIAGKHIILGVTGSIAAYKIASLASMLKKRQADVTVIMTENAVHFINPITFETLTGNKCLVDTFDRNFAFQVEHVALSKQADVVLTAPASADVIAKAAHGIADDMLTTTLLACTCPKLFAPAMNTRMYRNPIVQDNMRLLERYGMEVIAPDSGYLACGDTGEGKMPEPEVLCEYLEKALTPKDLAGRRVLVTAGPTCEKIDPVRYITNHSTGKMGYAVARAAMMRGADVTLVSGKTGLQPSSASERCPSSRRRTWRRRSKRLRRTWISSSRRRRWRTTARRRRRMKRSRKRTTSWPSRWSGRRIFWAIWANTAGRDSSCAAFPWRRSICWKIPAPSCRRSTST